MVSHPDWKENSSLSMKEGFAQKGSLSSSLWASRLSPLAQPFTMTHQGQESQSPLTKSTLTEPLAPLSSNHLDPFGDYFSQKSFSNLIALEEDELFVHSDPALSASAIPFNGHSQPEFVNRASQLRNQSRFLSSSEIDDSGLVSSALTPKPPLSSHSHQSLNVVGSSHLESFLKQDSKVNFSEATAVPNILNEAPIFGSSVTNSKPIPSGTYSIGNPFLCGNDSSYGGKFLLKANGKGVIQEEVSAVKSVSVKFPEPLTVTKSEHKAISECSKNFGSEAYVSMPSFVQSLNENEDDLDSPCWKGIQNSGRSFGRALEPVCSLRNQSEAGPSLNPKAPQFIPSHSKGVSNYSSNRVYEPGNDSTLLENTETSPVDRISPGHTRKDFTTGIKDALHNIEARFPLSDAENVPSFSCSGAESLDEYSDMLQYLSHSFSSCPNINVSMMVKAIHYLSELLIQNYTPDFGSLNGKDHDMIRKIIDNLYVPIKYMANGNIPSLGLHHTGSLDYRTRSTSILEMENTDFEATRHKDLVSLKFDSQSKHRWGQSYAHIPSTEIQPKVYSSLDMASGIGNGVVPVNRTTLKETLQVDEQFHPQALLSLWIEAQAALCSMKYENHILRLKLQTDGQN